MTTVWAARAGTWKDDPASGWSHVLTIQSLADVADGMERLTPPVRGLVSKLAIVAHGDEGGLIQLDPEVNVTTVQNLAYQITRLQKFLTPDAKLMFVCCVAGAGANGSKVLNEFSRNLPGRYVIGFEVSGRIGSSGVANRPGQVNADTSKPGFTPHPVIASESNSTALDEYSWFSKWSQDGKIIRLPLFEQSHNKDNRCAWPGCKGHAKPTERHGTFK